MAATEHPVDDRWLSAAVVSVVGWWPTPTHSGEQRVTVDGVAVWSLWLVVKPDEPEQDPDLHEDRLEPDYSPQWRNVLAASPTCPAQPPRFDDGIHQRLVPFPVAPVFDQLAMRFATDGEPELWTTGVTYQSITQPGEPYS